MDGQTDGWTITMNAAGPYLSADFDLDTANSFLWVKNAACIHFKVLNKIFFAYVNYSQLDRTEKQTEQTHTQADRHIDR
jgi:hypothetical protein